MGIISKVPSGKRIVGEIQTAFGYLRRQLWTAPDALDLNGMKSAVATSNSVTTDVTSFLAQPDFPRLINVDPGGTTADVPSGDVVVTGTNIRDEVISDAITFAANATASINTVKAFKTVTSVLFPVQDGASATYDIGWADGLGLDRAMSGNEVILATADGVYETTRPTVVFDADEVEKNFVTIDTSLDASLDVAISFISTE